MNSRIVDHFVRLAYLDHVESECVHKVESFYCWCNVLESPGKEASKSFCWANHKRNQEQLEEVREIINSELEDSLEEIIAAWHVAMKK